MKGKLLAGTEEYGLLMSHATMETRDHLRKYGK